MLLLIRKPWTCRASTADKWRRYRCAAVADDEDGSELVIDLVAAGIAVEKAVVDVARLRFRGCLSLLRLFDAWFRA